jgi:predicted nucleotidyltransferase
MEIDILDAARAIRIRRYPDASVVFAAGSLVRGEGTAYSDLDLVVVYPAVPTAVKASTSCSATAMSMP